MNQRLFIALGLSLVTVFALQYFTHKPDAPQAASQSQSGIQRGGFYAAPVAQCWHREPNREVDFIDVDLKPQEEKEVFIENSLYKVTLSNFGGVIKNFIFKKQKGKEEVPLETISIDVVDNKEDGCFLLAFDEKTPLMYNVISRNEKDRVQHVTYQAEHEGWIIQKRYSFSDDHYKVGLAFDFEPKTKNIKAINPRIFFPAPVVSEIKDNPMTGFVTKDGRKVEVVPAKEELAGVWGMPEIFGGQDKYFAHGLVKDSKQFVQGAYFKKSNNVLISILEGAPIEKQQSVSLSFYMGPKLLSDLSAVDNRLEDLLDLGMFSWIAKLLLAFLMFIYTYVGNFGLAIIVMTVLLKIPFLPLSIIGNKKRDEYMKFQPTITRIRNKYKHDTKKQNEELMRFHKEHNISPVANMVGCLPLLIQMPILFALYASLGKYLALYQAPFYAWIHDLSACDPYYVLPLLMGATMLWQQSLNPVGDDKQRVMMMFMPLVMTGIFINFPAGLVLYWLTNNVLSIGEDLLRKKLFS